MLPVQAVKVQACGNSHAELQSALRSSSKVSSQIPGQGIKYRFQNEQARCPFYSGYGIEFSFVFVFDFFVTLG